MYRLEGESSDSATVSNRRSRGINSPSGKRPLVIELEIPCMRCGYSLRGLKPSDVCPECGSPVIRSVYGDKLEFCEPRYVRTLGFGALIGNMAAWGLLGFCALAVLMVLLAFSGMPPALAVYAIQLIVGIGMPLCALVLLGSWFLLTTPNPGAPRPDSLRIVRRVERLVVILGAVVALAMFIMGTIGVINTLTPGVYLTVLSILGWALVGLIVVHLFVSARYLARLAGWLHAESVTFWATAQTLLTIAILLVYGLVALGVFADNNPIIIMGVLLGVLGVVALVLSHALALGALAREFHVARCSSDLQKENAPIRVDYYD